MYVYLYMFVYGRIRNRKYFMIDLSLREKSKMNAEQRARVVCLVYFEVTEI